MRAVGLFVFFLVRPFAFVRSPDGETVEATVAASSEQQQQRHYSENLSKKKNPQNTARLAQIHLLLNADSVWFFMVKTNKPLSASVEADEATLVQQ